MSVRGPLLLRDVWPFEDVDASPEIAMQPIAVFAAPLPRDTFRTIDVTPVPRDSAFVDIPPSGYAVLLDCQNGCLTVGHVDAHRARWIEGHRFEAPGVPPFRVVLDHRTALLDGLAGTTDFEARVERLATRDLRSMLSDKILGMVGGLGGTVLTFLALRMGLGAHALDLFLLLLGLAIISGLIGLTAQARARDTEATVLARLNAQFNYERALHPETAPPDPRRITQVIQQRIAKISEITTLGGFALLMCFVLFFVPSVTLAAFVAIVLAALVLSLNTRSQSAEAAVRNVQLRLARAVLAMRATRSDQLVPRTIPAVRRRVLRDQVGRYRKLTNMAARETIDEKLLSDVAQGLCLVLVIGGYLLSLQTGAAARGGGGGGMASLTDSPIIEMAPVLMLFSLAISCARVAQLLLAYSARMMGAAQVSENGAPRASGAAREAAPGSSAPRMVPAGAKGGPAPQEHTELSRR